MKKSVKRSGGRRQKEARREPSPASPETCPPPEGGAAAAAGTLYVVATPIGNLEDITCRALRILSEVRLIAAEDTRHTRILLDRYGIATPLTSLYDQNEAEKSVLLIGRLLGGEDVAYVSDAGTPGISDPGFVLIREALGRGIRVSPIPGPSALIAALSVSGLAMDHFVFLGFLPSKATRRRQLLTELSLEEKTLIFYESPHRLAASLADIAELLGDREVVVSREMTKVYEEFLRGSAAGVASRMGSGPIRGEVTLIVAGRAPGEKEYTDAELIEISGRIREEGQDKGVALSRRDLSEAVAVRTGVPRRRVYRLLLFP